MRNGACANQNYCKRVLKGKVMKLLDGDNPQSNDKTVEQDGLNMYVAATTLLDI